MSKEVDVTALDSKAKEYHLDGFACGALKIQAPILGHEVNSFEMNGVSYPLEGLTNIVFEVRSGEINTLRLEYIPKERDSGD